MRKYIRLGQTSLAVDRWPHRTLDELSPSYLETAYFGRKWMVRFLLQISSLAEVASEAQEGSRQAAAQALVKEQTESLVSAFLEKEAIVSQEGQTPTPVDTNLADRLSNLMRDMLAGYDKLPEEHLAHMRWLNPVLHSCIHTDNEPIRIAIQKLVQSLNQI